jgi:hypothetical protein
MGPILRAAGETGDPFQAFPKVLGIESDELFQGWNGALREGYRPAEALNPASEYGELLVGRDEREPGLKYRPCPQPGRAVARPSFTERPVLNRLVLAGRSQRQDH